MNQWQRIQELFDRMADLNETDRRALLLRETELDAVLRDQLEALLEADRLAPPLLNQSAADWISQQIPDTDPEELIGLSFGSYQIDQVVASGGMGDVYRGTRSLHGSAQEVILKVLRCGPDPDELHRRFQQEQKTLATLRHPYIVTLLDSGVLSGDRPYLVMERIDGSPLTRWCEAATPSLRERLGVFQKILAAVQHAHQNLVVHCDLKPNNVLVTAEGVPKLLDFGIAALLSDVAKDPASAQPMTQAYASPEQLRGEPVTTRSDVYALGALLHEMLTSSPAFSGSECFNPNRVPGVPSQMVESRSQKASLAGDLDAIIVKALQQDPDQRYASVEQFAADIDRTLHGYPVHAHPQSLRYRFRKLVRRKPWMVSGLVVSVLAVAAGFIGSEISRHQARAEARRGWGAHAQVKLANLYSGEIVTELTTTDQPWQSVIDRYAAELTSRFSDCPEAEGLATLTLAEVYAEHGIMDRAVPLLERAHELVESGDLGKREEQRIHELLPAKD